MTDRSRFERQASDHCSPLSPPPSSRRQQIAQRPYTTTLLAKSLTMATSSKKTQPATSIAATTQSTSSDSLKSIRMSRASRWQPLHCYCCATLLLVILLLARVNIHCQAATNEEAGGSRIGQSEIKTTRSITTSDSQSDDPGSPRPTEGLGKTSHVTAHGQTEGRSRRSMQTDSLVRAFHELRVSGSKSEPPSRPSVDWSKQRPYFGPDMARNVSVELGKTAYLTCKVYELGDKTVSWLRPRENEILTAGRYTYIGDSRFASINDNGSHDWILEIKDVGLNDSTSYECQVSTDPKMSAIINLQVKAAKAKIKQGEQFYAPVGSNIEFTCEIGQRAPAYASMPSNVIQQTYWYYNGNLLNYAKAHSSLDKNFSIEWDSMTQTSRFRLFNLQLNDAGNYTCKPTSAEPATIRLHVKRFNKNNMKDRTHYGNGYHSANTKEAQRTRPHFVLDTMSGLEMMADSGVSARGVTNFFPSFLTLISCLLSLLLVTN